LLIPKFLLENKVFCLTLSGFAYILVIVAGGVDRTWSAGGKKKDEE
jgi:hypothetical protein